MNTFANINIGTLEAQVFMVPTLSLLEELQFVVMTACGALNGIKNGFMTFKLRQALDHCFPEVISGTTMNNFWV